MPPLEDLSCQFIVSSSLLNNCAVAWIHVGEFGLAHQLLSRAIDDLQRKVDDASQIIPNSTAQISGSCCSHERSSTFTCGCNRDDVLFSGLLPFASCTMSTPNRDDDDDAGSFILFDRPLIVETTLAIYRHTPDLVQAAIYYNLALLYHKEGINSGKSVYAKQADHLYEAANAAINIAIDRGACTQCEASLMLLAIWNNRTHINCLSIIDLSSADLFVKKMKDVLQKYTPGVSMPLSDLRIFFLNILVLHYDYNGMVVGSASAA